MNQFVSYKQEKTKAQTGLAPIKVQQLLEAGAVVIDLRSVGNRRLGIIPKTLAISAELLQTALNNGTYGLPRISEKDDTVILVCDTGVVSAIEAEKLRQSGFDHATYLEGGFSAWEDKELEVVIPEIDFFSTHTTSKTFKDAISTHNAHSQSSGVVISPLSGYTGAEIFGLDLSQPLSEEHVKVVRDALLRWKVVFFRDQFISSSQLVGLGNQFGHVMKANSPMQIYSVDNQPEILVVGKSEYPGRGVDSPWHADLSFLTAPPMGSLLQAIDVPPYGGDTTFTNLTAVYEGLSEPIRTMLDGLWAVHHDRFHDNGISSVHPVVRVHPETGERLIWVNPNYTNHIIGLTKRESAELLKFLFDQIRLPAYTARFRWYPGSIAFWDNRGSAHAAPTDIPNLDETRILYRITIEGDIPFDYQGKRSYPFDGVIPRY